MKRSPPSASRTSRDLPRRSHTTHEWTGACPVVAVYTHAGTKLVSYKYDAWGNTSTTYHNGGSITSAANNPFKYRGYYYDADLGLYYLNSRYYDAKTGRFISPDDVGYLGTNGDLNSYNLYAYCSNNPVMYTDPSGHSILAALIIGFVVGATIGSTIGGVVSYNVAKDSGAEGSDLLEETLIGVAKGFVIGGIFGGLTSATGGVVLSSSYGFSSVLGTAMLTNTVTVAARTIEVASLQCKKSIDDEKSSWQVANDSFCSIYNNIGKILSPTAMKTVTTANGYIGYYKTDATGFNQYAKTNKNKAMSWFFAGYACLEMLISIASDNPTQRAYKRGYSLI